MFCMNKSFSLFSLISTTHSNKWFHPCSEYGWIRYDGSCEVHPRAQNRNKRGVRPLANYLSVAPITIHNPCTLHTQNAQNWVIEWLHIQLISSSFVHAFLWWNSFERKAQIYGFHEWDLWLKWRRKNHRPILIWNRCYSTQFTPIYVQYMYITRSI